MDWILDDIRHIIVEIFRCDSGSVIYDNSLFFGDALKSLGVTCHDICS